MVYCHLAFHNSLIKHDIIHQTVFGYFDLYLLLFKTITSDMKAAQKILDNLINEHIFLLNVSRFQKRTLSGNHMIVCLFMLNHINSSQKCNLNILI